MKTKENKMMALIEAISKKAPELNEILLKYNKNKNFNGITNTWVFCDNEKIKEICERCDELDEFIIPLIDDYISGYIKNIPMKTIEELYYIENKHYIVLKKLQIESFFKTLLKKQNIFTMSLIFLVVSWRFSMLTTLNVLTRNKIKKNELRRALYIIRESQLFVKDFSMNGIFEMNSKSLITDLIKISDDIKNLWKSSIRERKLASILIVV
jgi:hypothetical protein